GHRGQGLRYAPAGPRRRARPLRFTPLHPAVRLLLPSLLGERGRRRLMKRVTILGATGSIGASALAVISQHEERFRPYALTANSNVQALEQLVARWRPAVAVVADSPPLPPRRTAGTTWLYGRQALLDVAGDDGADVVINALVGAAGLEPTLR